jgi:hypothetical protein
MYAPRTIFAAHIYLRGVSQVTFFALFKRQMWCENNDAPALTSTLEIQGDSAGRIRQVALKRVENCRK